MPTDHQNVTDATAITIQNSNNPKPALHIPQLTEQSINIYVWASDGAQNHLEVEPLLINSF